MTTTFKFLTKLFVTSISLIGYIYLGTNVTTERIFILALVIYVLSDFLLTVRTILKESFQDVESK